MEVTFETNEKTSQVRLGSPAVQTETTRTAGWNVPGLFEVRDSSQCRNEQGRYEEVRR